MRIRSKIENPTANNLSDQKFRSWIIRVFLCDDPNLNTAKTDLINNVRKRGTEEQLNEIFGRIREAGFRPYFPETEMGTVDSAFHNKESDKLVWLVHSKGEDRTEFETELYQHDILSNKWIPAEIAKERKYPTGSQ